MAAEDALAARTAVEQFLAELSGPERQMLLLTWKGPDVFDGKLYRSPVEALEQSGIAVGQAEVSTKTLAAFDTYVVGAEVLVLIVDNMTQCTTGEPFADVFRFPLAVFNS